jgi:hypothetical protein
VPQKWRNGDEIYTRNNCRKLNYGFEDSEIHREEQYEKTGKEEEPGNFYHDLYHFNQTGWIKAIDAVGKECADPRSVV